MNAIIYEQGNGWPSVGDYVRGPNGDDVYRVVSFYGPIHTGQPGEPNYVHATVEWADWDDVTDETEPTCSCSLTDEDED